MTLEEALGKDGEVLQVLDQQDSGCVSYVWRAPDGALRLIKQAVEARARPGLERVWRLHQEVSHPTLVPPLGRRSAPDGPALVFEFLPGELLYDYTKWTSHARQHDPASPHVRFRALETAEILTAYEAVLDAHVAIERAGWIAVDLYDGCLLYDFKARSMRLIDLDEYQPGPFALEADRLPGSRRFMAPEEFERGAWIDGRTNVFALGQMARILLTQVEGVWAHGEEARAVLERATRAEPGARFESVSAFAQAWRAQAAKIARPRT